MNGEPTQELIGELEFWESITSRWRGISIESLEAAGSVRKFLTRQEFIEQGDQLQAEFEAEQTPEEKAEAEELEEASSRILKALGLIPASADLSDQSDQLTDDFVGGFFSPDTRELNVILNGSEGRFSPGDIRIYVHEFVHLMQEVEYGLFDILEELESDDEYVAFQSLFEGEAEWVSQLAIWQTSGIDYLLATYEVEEPVDVETGAGDGSDETVEVSEFLLGSFAFPYLHGQAFLSEALTPITPHLSALQDGTLTQEQADENFAAWSQRLNELYERPPATTEQVLHYDKYLANEPAIDVTIATEQEITDAGWTEMWRSDWGEGGLRTWLEASNAAYTGFEGNALADSVAIDDAVSGWGGDELIAMRSSCGHFASVALIEWDDPANDPWEFTSTLLRFLVRDERFGEVLDPANTIAAIIEAPVGFVGVWGGPNDDEAVVVTADTADIVDDLVGWALGELALIDPCGVQ